MPLVKWLLAIPHYIVLIFLTLAALVSVIIAWFAILFTGPIAAGAPSTSSWACTLGLAGGAYAFLLVTDRYPPFSLE